jgi:c-di-GMP-binding flagellar brake protein YcgR
MSLLKKLWNKRKQQRYHTHGHAYLVLNVGTDSERKLQIIDVSQGGCAFIYYGDKADIESGVAKLMTGHCVHIEDIKYEVRSDKQLTVNDRRCGIEFRWMGGVDKKGLAEFVNSAALFPCP